MSRSGGAHASNRRRRRSSAPRSSATEGEPANDAMTNTSHAPPLACADLAGAIAALRARGLRLSASRRLVLEALYAADRPMSAEHLTRRLHLDPTSVYRNLETLESH